MFGASTLSLVTAAVSRTTVPQMATVFTKRTFFLSAPFIGNGGFDPLGIVEDKSKLVALRHAEVKHGRLAMLAAVAWPAQELVHPLLADALHLPSICPDGYTPSLWNGGINAASCAPAMGLAIVLGAAFDLKDMYKRNQAGLGFNEWAMDSVAGDLDFDPLGLARDLSVTERYELQEAEMINGRFAMLGLVAYLLIELGTGQRVVDFHMPALF